MNFFPDPRDQIYGYQREGGAEDRWRDRDWHIRTAACKTDDWRTYRRAQGTAPTNSVVTYMGKEPEIEWIYVRVERIPFVLHLKLTTL